MLAKPLFFRTLWFRISLIVTIILAALVAPLVVTHYTLTFLLQLFMMVALAQSWNLISGITGYVSFGHTAFFGIGAYTGALILTASLPLTASFSPEILPWFSAILYGFTILCGVAISLLIALPLGLLTLRLQGPYFAIAMLGINELGRMVATLWVDLTDGGDGIPLDPAVLPELPVAYYIMFFLGVLATGLVAWIYHSRLGLELRTIREDEGAAEMIGVNTVRNKILAFILSAAIPGAVGTVYVMYTSFIDPYSAFTPILNLQMIVIVLLGGSGTVWGPVLGAVIIMGSREFMWAEFPAAHLALLGILVIIVVFYMPKGILGLVNQRKGLRVDHVSDHQVEKSTS
uniref:Amino acid/amide ABC transporter membrane protein 2, HAAT family n=1 Tax=Candidatus Kentrum sp. MB TaxID=2138164 RepID=A0A450XBK8_9GAMM|nr:MAG: amino acid/amide ABC transporter membrane protein 2, HAAT family [Candidatus Kentron sp. MB]VFK31622.1 MAG: amino acid/amide ABC transporter membrane protein 2, HAAT family [Candidatus Kentron sp. MB]VFK75869.1 MAG: amino acid/amide ABC transporter membrane protein 2, HAAT family [Candidatus Kentron sp. MB]